MMQPFAACMYEDAVEFFRNTPSTGSQGASRRNFDGIGTDYRASVQSTTVSGSDAQGRPYTTEGYAVFTPSDPAARRDDKFVWRGRTLNVVGPTSFKGIGVVAWRTECLETQ